MSITTWLLYLRMKKPVKLWTELSQHFGYHIVTAAYEDQVIGAAVLFSLDKGFFNLRENRSF